MAAVVSVTSPPFWIIADVGSVDDSSEDCFDNCKTVVEVDVVVVDSAEKGLPHTTLRLPFNPPEITREKLSNNFKDVNYINWL